MISNPNLVSQIAKLPHLSDEQLKTYISDKGNPLSPFALATLQSKAIARKKFGAPEAPKQTVAEQVEAEASAPLGAGIAGLQPQGAPAQMPPPQGAPMPPPPMPMQQPPMPQGMAGGGMVAFDEGGVASLPLPDDMYSEDNYAKGGIVGYASKGSVDYEGLTQEKFDALTQEQQQMYTDAYRNRQIMGNGSKAVLSPLFIAGGLESNLLRGANNLLTPIGKAIGVTDPLTKDMPYYNFDEMVPEMGTYPRAPKELRELLPPTATKATAKPAVRPVAPTGEVTNEVPAAVDTPKVDVPKADNPLQSLLVARTAPTAISPYTVEKAKIEGIKSPAAFDRTKYNEERRQALIDAGVDPLFYENQAAKNETEREALKGEREQAKWMAGLQTGFGIMGGTSQNPFENISKGATAGLAQYGADIKDIKSDEKALRAADDKLAEAQYLQGRGDAEGALKAMKDREALIASVDAMNVQARNVNETAFAGDKNKATSAAFTAQQAANEGRLDRASREAVAASSAATQLAVAEMAPAEVRTATAYAKSKGVSLDQALMDLKLGPAELRLRESVTKSLLTSNPMLADDPANLAKQVDLYISTMSNKKSAVPDERRKLFKPLN